MKVLLVHNHYRQRSGEDVVFELEREMLLKHGHQLTTYHRNNDEIRVAGPLCKVRLLGETLWSLRTRREMRSVLRSSKPDVVHAHNTFPLISPSIYAACREAGVPVVQTLHNYRLFCAAGTFFRDGSVCEACLDDGRWRGVAHGCYRNSRTATAASALIHATHRQLESWNRAADIFVALTDFSRDKLVQAGIPAAKLRVKPNFVHPDPGIGAGGGAYALYVGRLSPEKRVDTLLEAWAHLSHSIPLLIVGGGPQREALEREAERLRLDSVCFVGPQPRSAAIEMMRNARFLVCCSGWYESFPMVIGEAFACGVPVICPRLGLVTDGRTGLHYAPGDAGDLAEKAEWAWTHGRETEAMRREARREYEVKYTAEANHPLLIDIYEEAIRKRRSDSITAGDWTGAMQPWVTPWR